MLCQRRRHAAAVRLVNNAAMEGEAGNALRKISTSRKPEAWAGYKKEDKWGTIDGAKDIAFKRSRLKLAHAEMGRSRVGSYFNSVLARGLAGRIHVPGRSLFSTREHWSVSDGKLQLRPGTKVPERVVKRHSEM